MALRISVIVCARSADERTGDRTDTRSGNGTDLRNANCTDESQVMIPMKNSTSSKTRMRTIVASRNSPRAIAVCSTAKR